MDSETEPLYQKDGHLYTHTTRLTHLAPLSTLPAETQALFKPPPAAEGDTASSEAYILITKSTIFHAQGGGQPSDVGTMTPAPSGPSATNAAAASTADDNDDDDDDNQQKGSTRPVPTFHVHQVRKVLSPSSAAILHMGTFAPPTAHTLFPVPSPSLSTPTSSPSPHLLQSINIPIRTLHSRLHTAGHALGLAIHLLSLSSLLPHGIRDAKASHYPGAAFVEFTGPLIMGDKKEVIQKMVDELVKQNLGVKVLFWSAEEAAERCIGGLEGVAVVGKGEDVRVVDIGDGLGSYACGGTHVKRLGECGRVVVRGVKRQKGVSRVSYEVVDG